MSRFAALCFALCLGSSWAGSVRFASTVGSASSAGSTVSGGSGRSAGSAGSAQSADSAGSGNSDGFSSFRWLGLLSLSPLAWLVQLVRWLGCFCSLRWLSWLSSLCWRSWLGLLRALSCAGSAGLGSFARSPCSELAPLAQSAKASFSCANEALLFCRPRNNNGLWASAPSFLWRHSQFFEEGSPPVPTSS